ncbi:MAG: hypothetical protein ABMA13_13325 [Chthoniobacteraceae bacterium]
MKPRTLLAASITAALSITGCTTKSAYYRNDETPPAESVRNGVQHNYNLAFVEFHEDGYAQDERQLAEAGKLIRKARKPIVVVYVHGWHNSSKSKDVCRFERFIHGLANTPIVRAHGHEIVGVYVGWRGESVDAERLGKLSFVNTFSYWDREDAGHLLANGKKVGAGTSLLAAVRQLGREVESVRARGVGCQSVLLGHSFGGLVLEETIGQAIEDGLETGSEDAITWDLAITLNCANRAAYSRGLLEKLDEAFTYEAGKGFVARKQRSVVIPAHRSVLIAVGAANDRATKVALPLGNWLGSVFKLQMFGLFEDDVLGGKPVNWFTRRPIPYEPGRTAWEGEFNTSSVTNNRDLINMRVEPLGFAKPSDIPQIYRDASALELNVGRDLVGDVFFTRGENDGHELIECKDDVFDPASRAAASGDWRRWRFVFDESRRSLYKVINVPEEIIDDHGGIWSDQSVALIGALFRQQLPLARGEKRQPVRILKDAEAAASLRQMLQRAP